MGLSLSEERKEIKLGPMRVRELIKVAVTSLFGEEASKDRFQWELISFDEREKVAKVSLVTCDYVGFAGALALLPSSEGRLRILQHHEGQQDT
jgi:hypothetical protein